MKRGPKLRPAAWAGALLFAALALATVVRITGDSLYDYPPNPPTLPQDGVIVTLAGGKHRIEAAYTLFADGVGTQLWIIGAGKRSTVMGLARAQATEVAQKIPWDRFDRIQVETESRNTIENAFAVKHLLEQNPGVKNIVLVTSPYHMRRSLFMLGQHIPPAVHLIPYTPPSADFGAGNWWHSWMGISLTIEETIKLELARVLIPRLGYF